MYNWIIGIGSLVFGGGLIANVVMHYIKKYDEHKDSQRDKLYSIQDSLAEYRNIVFQSLMNWHTLFSEFINLSEAYVSALHKDNIQMEESYQSYKEYNSHQDCYCELAETCSMRVILELSDEEKKIVQDFNQIEIERQQREQIYLSDFSKILSEISNQITPYGDFLARLKDVYKLEKQTLDALYPSLRSIDSTNIKLQYKLRKPYTYIEDCLSEFKEIGNLLTTLIGDIEKTQREINKQIN